MASRSLSHQLMGLLGWLLLVFAAAAVGAGHRGALASVEVLVLLVLIAATIRAFWQISRIAAGLLLPYVLWVAFASALTWSVWQANPHLL
jgi:tryptophan-rich sensory protein